MLHPDKAYHQGKVRLVFAGQESLNGYQQMAVKFEANEGFSTKVGTNPRRIEIRQPDRTLYILSRGKKENVLLPFPTDAVVSTRRDTSQWSALDTDVLLFNPVHSPQLLDTRPYLRAGIEVLVDSGGFQLIQGTRDFISPADTAEFYTNHASIGVGLDFPANPFIDAILFKENCELQRLNNEYIRANVPEQVTIAPVVHGTTPETRMHCLKKVYDRKRDPVMAVSGMITSFTHSLPVIKQRFACLAAVLHASRKDVVYYHLLGATSSMWQAISTLLTHSGYVNSMGGDSVSHRQQAVGGSYGLYPHFDGFESWTQPVETDLSAALACPCPVCSLAGDARVLRDFRLSELHHTYVAAASRRVMVANVKQYMAGNISRRDLWTFMLGKKRYHSFRHIPDLAFDYFEDVIVKGYENVPKLVPDKGNVKKKSSLFGSGGPSTAEKEMEARYRSIHREYEKFHKVSLRS